ncbi:MAG: hypothetical protein K0R67_3148, partial [Paenibacillus sp.]|nr:hypothetical protein [Paenibacillus sp.]
MAMKKVNFLLFLLSIFALFLLNLFLPKGGEAVSKLEMRTLKPFPEFSMTSLWSGQYFREFDNYFADHFVFRDTLVQVGTQIKDLRGLQGEEKASIVVQKGGNNMFQDRVKGGLVVPPDIVKEQNALAGKDNPGSTSPGKTPAVTPDPNAPTHPGNGSSPSPTGASTPTPTPAHTPTEAGSDTTGVRDTESERYLVLKDRAMTLYSYYPSAAQSLTKGINDFQSRIDPKIKVYSMLAPSPVEFIKETKYKELSASQQYAVNQVNQMYNKNVIGIDAHKELSKHAEEYIYFRTDHHWTALGAYYGYKAFMDQIGEKPVPLGEYETEQLKGYLGSAYSATLDANLKKNPDTVTIYKPFVPYEYSLYWSNDAPLSRNVVDIDYGSTSAGGYAAFLGGDSPWGDIRTENSNGKKLLVIKDSYGSPVIPFLLPHYEQIYFIDLRYFDMHILDFVKERGITEVLFINGISTTTYEGYDEMLL